MNIYISTERILQFLTILSWIIFIGLCIETCSYITSTLFSLFLEPSKAKLMWHPIDLSSLFAFDQGYYAVVSFFVILVGILKALLFYFIIRILQNKNFNMSQPFSDITRRFIFSIAYTTLAIGLSSSCGADYTEWFMGQGVKMPTLEQMSIGGSDVWLFMSVTLFVIAHIFKKGIEIQTENELTV